MGSCLSPSSSLPRPRVWWSLGALSTMHTGVNDSPSPEDDLGHWLQSTSDPSATLGLAFSKLSVSGVTNGSRYQQTFATYPISFLRWITGGLLKKETISTPILTGLDGLLHPGEMCLVLGRPGSGCSTFLKTISGNRAGLLVDPATKVQYAGISDDSMHSRYRSESLYCADEDIHFPDLNVTHTLEFAARAKPVSPQATPEDHKSYPSKAAATMLTSFFLEKCAQTKVGNEVKRGISGGEKKRVSLAEVMSSRARIQCWDSSTSGLDSATSTRFIQNLRRATDAHGSVALAALYQVSRDTCNTFDKVLLLFEGRQIFFGPTQEALLYFERLGFVCPRNFTVPDFLTALTHPLELHTLCKKDAKNCPRTSVEFAEAWEHSVEKQALMLNIDKYMRDHSSTNISVRELNLDRLSEGPYSISLLAQLHMCLQRAMQRFQTNIGASISMAVGNLILALIIGSVFYNLPSNAETLLRRSILLFYIITINAFLFSAEVAMLWEHRPIIEKHRRFAFHHPMIEAASSMLCDLPNKILASLAFNIPIYFMSNLRRSASAFFTFYIISFVCLLTLSMFFRMAGSFSRSIVQTIVPVGVYLSVCVIYSGFILPVSSMLSWLSWIRFVNPLYFALESVMINEFDGRAYPCQKLIPSGASYSNSDRFQKACSVASAEPGSHEVDGTVYIRHLYGFRHDCLWRNLGILLAMLFIFCVIHLLASEYIKPPVPRGTVLEFRQGVRKTKSDLEASNKNSASFNTAVHKANERIALEDVCPTLQWKDISYFVKINKSEKKIISEISGYIRKGEVTALMGATGSGKTSLLNALAHRTHEGLSGEILYEGQVPSTSFQRLIGYAQQEDVHLHTATVREALIFSAQLRRPSHSVTSVTAIEVVEEVIEMLEMDSYADAVVGHLGEGLNLGQRRRLTIAVELVAQPSGILFLDEPTSNLDSQTAWSICMLLRKLAANGLAILCTIHQPSSSLINLFDKLLLLGRDGHQLYFGDFGQDANIMIEYFEEAGARACRSNENPAEWMLEVTEKVPETRATSWGERWRTSRQRNDSMRMLEHRMEKAAADKVLDVPQEAESEFAASFTTQYTLLVKRTSQEFWRSPSYIWSKFGLCIGIALFVGVSLWMSPLSLQGLQSQLFSLFLIFTIGNSGMKQIIYSFSHRRILFEARESHSKIYSRSVFVLASITAELPWQTLTAVPVFFLWYFPTGIFRTAEGGERAERGALLFLLLWAFFVFMGTFAVMVGSAIKSAPVAANIAVVLYQLMLLFCGVLAAPAILPRFWIWMYRISPLTYLVSGMMSASIADVSVTCQASETVNFTSPPNMSCGKYIEPYVRDHGGYLLNPEEVDRCSFCPWTTTNSYLSTVGIESVHKWRDFGIFLVFVLVNIFFALVLYEFTGPKKHRKDKKNHE
ncbi:ATP-binding cassette transporter [Clathrospora elynae]|uniref:ATP-binding cassette transporter n=1 Tax=Clathrospora elynae TaxID=706981 RepID=A0A6A5SNF4_9PLEO|nr:ATP-binding cassette transporter [Clathrospora elynae]